MTGVELGISLVLLFILILLFRSGGGKKGKSDCKGRKPHCRGAMKAKCHDGKWKCKCGHQGDAPAKDCKCVKDNRGYGWACSKSHLPHHHNQPEPTHNAFCVCEACVVKVEHIINDICADWEKRPSAFIHLVSTYKDALPLTVMQLVNHPAPVSYQERKSIILAWLAGMTDGQRATFVRDYMRFKKEMTMHNASSATEEAAVYGMYNFEIDRLLSPY
jgi:hypothetical protein